MSKRWPVPASLNPVETGVKAIRSAMWDGSCVFGREDLPFMDLVGTYAEEIPFHSLLKQINETPRQGLDVGGDDA